MKLYRSSAAVLATTVLAAGLAAASPASAVSTEGGVATTGSSVVVAGALDGFRGNRHQLNLTTGDGMVHSTSTLRSYYCPSGASITPTWASVKCTHRATYKLSNFAQNNETSTIGRISSTGKSATQKAPVNARNTRSGRTTTIGVNLSLFGQINQSARVTGRVHTQTLQSTHRYGIFGYPG